MDYHNYERRGSETIIEQSVILHDPNYGQDILQELNLLRLEGSFTDTILCVESKELPCHRNVLAVSSPYFKAMFTCDLKERSTSKIRVNSVSPDTLQRVVDYAYTGKLEITVNNAQEMLAAASMFQYPAIKDACCEFLFKHLHPSNCLGIEDFAQMHVCSNLELEAHQYTLDNFSLVVEEEEFLEIPFERLITYIASDLIDVRNEEIVYEAAMRWVRHDNARQSHLEKILENIRLVTVDRTYLETIISKDPLIQSSDACVFLTEEAVRYHETCRSGQQGARRRSMQKEIIQPRPSTVAKEVIVLVGGLGYNLYNRSLQTVEMYEPTKDRWISLPTIPESMTSYSVCALGNDIYICGGIDDNEVLSGVWKFDPVVGTWQKRSDMITPRAKHAAAPWKDNMYILGGIHLMDDGNLVAVESIECYNVTTDAWTVVGQCMMPRKQSHAVPYNDTLVEIGGTQSGAKVPTMESYRCHDHGVTYSGEQFILPEAIQFSKIIVINNIFFIIWEDTKKFISLNPQKQTFRRLADMNYSHIHCGATLLGGKIYVLGGLVDGKPSKIIECYDPATDQWTVIKSTMKPRACHGCVTIQMC